MRNPFRILVLTSLLLAAFQLPPSLTPAADASAAPAAQTINTPEGAHDGSQGVVGAGSCGASGWAVDPDDRYRDVQVRVVADGNPVATVTADLPREGLEACPDGNCGYAANLWGLISAGDEHTITVQAYDVESETWFDLPDTPKSLTCIGFPEGFHDGSQGTVDQYGCNANGWAVDPDDRDRDVTVVISSDGTEVGYVLANVYREDMETLGICPGGTCSWFADLWGLISHDVEHQITAQVFDEETNALLDLASTPKALTCASPPPPAPILTVSTSNNYLRVDHFAPNTTVTFTVYPSAADGEPAMWADSRTTDDSGFAIIWPWEGPPDVVVDNYVVATDGTSTKDLVLEAVTIDVFDPATDLAAGTASPGELVHVVVGNDDGYPAWMDVNAEGDGTWTADFAGTFDIPWDMWGSAHVYDDEGDVTVYHLGPPPPPPNPLIRVFPDGDFIDGEFWPPDQTVHLEIDDPATPVVPDFVIETVADGTGHMETDLPGYDLKRGDTVLAASGDIDFFYTVRQLFVTGLDIDTQTVSGTVDGQEVVHIFSGPGDVYVDSDGDGNWLADFSTVGEPVLYPGACVSAEAWGGSPGSSTIVQTCLPPPPPSPWLLAFPEFEMVQGWEWPMDASVHLEIDDPSTEASPDYQADGTTAPTPWGDPRSYVEFAFGGAYDLKAGDVVTLTDGTSPQTHVVRHLSVLEVDVAADTITGSAGAGADVVLWPHEFDQTATVQVSAGDDGVWLADFSGLFDLVGGTAGRAQAPDEAGNATAVDWRATLTRLTIFLDRPMIEGYEWPDGATVTVTVADKEACTSSAVAGYPEWDPQNTFFWIEFPSDCVIVPGDVVTMTDGDLTITHVVQDLAVTEVNVETETVTGTANFDPSLYELHGWIDGIDDSFVTPVAEGGAFAVDFGTMGFDLQPGMSGRMELTDGASNGTAYDWRAPNPRFTAFPEWDFIEGWEWPLAAVVHLAIDDPATAMNPDHEQDGTVGYHPDDPSTVWVGFGFGGLYDLKVGDHVSLSDGATTKETIVTALAVTWHDLDEDFVGGSATPGTDVHIWVHGLDSSFMNTTPDELGDWGVDFGDVGYDVVPGTAGRAEQVDPDTDATAVDWIVPVPVQVDIRPWSDLNLVACRATWDLLPVAVLSTADFDATAIDHDSVRFGETGGEAQVVVVAGRPLRYARDVNGDGLVDMVYTFRFGDTGFGCADIPAGQRIAEVEGILTGWSSGVLLEGSDTMRLFNLLLSIGH